MRLTLLTVVLAVLSGNLLLAQQKDFTFTVYFDLDKYQLTETAQAELEKIPATLEFAKSYDIELLANTDNQGTQSYNYKLAARRASSVLNFLGSLNIQTRDAVLRNFGEDHPVHSNEVEDGRSKNRRVDIHITAQFRESVQELMAELGAGRTQEYNINPTENTKIFTREGGLLLVPANAFRTADGQAVSGPVKVVIQEDYTRADMLLSGLTTTSGGKILVSGGMVNVKAYAGKEELQLQAGRSLSMGMPVLSEEGWDKEMELFVGGDADPHEAAINWRSVRQPATPMPPMLRMRAKPNQPQRDNFHYRKPEFTMVEPYLVRYPNLREPRKPEKDQVKVDLNFFQKLFLSKAGKEKRLQEKYEKMMDRYESRLERYTDNKNLRDAAIEKYRKDSVDYWFAVRQYRDKIQKEEKDFYDNIDYHFSEAMADYEAELEKWNEELAEKRQLFEQGYTKSGNINNKQVSRYFFEMNRLGWINCDKFWNVEDDQKQTLAIADNDTSEESIYIVFKTSMSILPVRTNDEGGYISDPLPKGAPIQILGIKVKEGRSYMAILETEVGAQETAYDLAYEQKSLKEMQEMFRSMN